jgi:hypothetical protein
MDSKDLRALMEGYSAVYSQDETLDELTEEDLEEIVEEVILNLLDEGYSIDDVDLIFEDEEIFEEILSEARVTSSADRESSSGSATVTKGTGSRMAAASRMADMKRSRMERRKEKVKSAIKSGIAKVRSAVDEPAREYASKRKLVPSKSGKTTLTSPAIQAKQRTSAGRREVRSRVAGDIAQRAKAKLGRGIEKAKTLGAGVASAASSAPSAAKSAVKKGIGKAARALSRGARSVARRLGEEVDVYDIILEHLLDEGYADTEEAATVIMVNMSEEWREEILEMHPAQLERIAQQAAGKVKVTSVKPKKKPAKNKAGMQ